MGGREGDLDKLLYHSGAVSHLLPRMQSFTFI